MYEVFDDTAAQVLLAIRSGDSIRRVSQHLQTPYETVRQAVDRLETAGFLEYEDGLIVTNQTVRQAALRLVASSSMVSPPTIEEAYTIPHFGEWPFAFCRIDAAFIWTEGGYQVSRGPDDYPLFLAVREEDVDEWDTFFAEFGLSTSFERQPRTQLEGPIQIVLDPRESLTIEEVGGYPVIPLEETVAYMQTNFAHFQSGLSMLDRMYDELDLDVAYTENERAGVDQ